MTYYSGTGLSISDDKLVALVGIIELLQDNLHCEASSYGLSLGAFVDELLWHHRETIFIPREIDECVPSWSWLSARRKRMAMVDRRHWDQELL